MTDLHSVLDKASDRIESPGLAGSALAVARRRRSRQRGALIASAAALAVIATVVGAQVLSTDSPRPSPAPSPEPDPSFPPGGDVPPGIVHPALTVPFDLPQDHSLRLPADLTPPDGPVEPVNGPAIAAVQMADGVIRLVNAAGSWQHDEQIPAGSLFRTSLAGDGGALAVRTAQGFGIYSIFADRDFEYEAPDAGDSGFWLPDSVGFAYDIPGPGAESREHEGPFRTDTLVFPESEDLDNVAMAWDSRLHEFVDGDYLQWPNGRRGQRLDMSHLGELRYPVAGRADGLVAVVRSGLGSGAAVDADGVLVLDFDGQPVALLPIAGVPIAEVQPHLWVGETRMLLEVGDALVLWDAVEGGVRRVASLPAGATVSLSDGKGTLVRY